MDSVDKPNKTEKSEVAEREEKILKFWQENKIFEKSLEKNKGKKEFVFYDGPPFATGLPHYGHVLPSTMKDVIPRYKTMRGFHVDRVWGWDCHGLPIENLIEKELGLNSKKEIEEYGIDKFNKKAEESVLRYEKEWKELIPRIGRWVDMENDYKTMNASYTESIWWAFKTLYDKGLAYEGYKSMHLCPRCETTLSNFEVNQGYKDITDISVIVKFELVDEPGTYLLAWTTTPWTLPGNVALAIGEDVRYVKVSVDINSDKIEARPAGGGRNIMEDLQATTNLQRVILAKEKVGNILNGKAFKIEEEFSGKDLVGKKYMSLFKYFSGDLGLENRENGWKVYGADFVSTEEGTGVVHVAPAFGEDDMEIGKKYNLPFIQHVKRDGRFVDQVADFAGRLAKPKDDPQSTDIEIIKKLAYENKLFAKQKIEHSYPHCWRCDTPLLNYASSSWFVAVSKIKDKLVANNKMTKWVPEAMRDGRFGNWLKGARDWAISRSRYWGAPLPIWTTEDKSESVVIGSVEELKKYIKSSGNSYFAMRHGLSESNEKKRISCRKNEHGDFLTEDGEKQSLEKVKWAKGSKIDLIITSPFTRTRQTADIIAKEFEIEVIEDFRIGEINLSMVCGKDINEYHSLSKEERLNAERNKELESWNDVRMRATSVLYELEDKYKNKNILLISHDAVLRMLEAGAMGFGENDVNNYTERIKNFQNAEVRNLNFVPLPHNKDFSINLHMPHIDDVELEIQGGKKLIRTKEVFDCWFESGAMPFASLHYPFENKGLFEKRLPSDFIAEGLDQTRGWFYSLMVLATGIFGKPAFKNVVVNGLILAENGQKMSKSLGNFEPVEITLNSLGADAIRLFLMASPAVHAEDVSFSPKVVKEHGNQVAGRLRNVVSLYDLYKNETDKLSQNSPNILDKWVLIRLENTIKEITKALDNYLFDKAARPIFDFVDDFSNWYIRRSRDRFKKGNTEDSEYALATTRYILVEISKAIAPTIPFIAEEIYQAVRTENDPESVHLTNWSEIKKNWFINLFGGKRKAEVLKDMQKTRELISLALEARSTAGIKVRQPLRKLSIPSLELGEDYKELIKEEVNVKEVIVDGSLGENNVVLDQNIDEELEKEGAMRELVRSIQALRKKMKLFPKDMINLKVKTDSLGSKLIENFREEINSTTGLKAILFVEYLGDGEEVKEGKYSWNISISS